MSLYYITDTNWITFITIIVRQRAVYGLSTAEKLLFWNKLSVENHSSLVVNKYRAVSPVKSFFFPAREEVTAAPGQELKALVGVKACDLGHLKTDDAIFLGGVMADPYFEAKRKNTFIISADCSEILPTCFCTKMGGTPYATGGFDINLSPVRSGFVAETGSDAAERIVQSHRKLFQDVRPEHLEERKQLRERVTGMVKKNNEEFTWTDPKDIVGKAYASKKWEAEIAASCVECDACRFSCGSCYCFLLHETAVLWNKTRSWDSCQSEGYGRVAGGANPRKTRAERLRNMYTCKLLYRPENFGFSACTGCGRCIEVCQGKIDIRKSLQKLHNELQEPGNHA